MFGLCNRLKIELDLQSLFGLLYSLAETPHNSPLPPHLVLYSIRGRYWSAKIEDISMLTPGLIEWKYKKFRMSKCICYTRQSVYNPSI